MAKLTTIRVLLALADNKERKLWQMDVKNTLLHRELDQEICMNQLRGFENKAHLEYVCKLRKSFYGLKQVPRV